MHVIANPQARMGKSAKITDIVTDELLKRGIPYTLDYTEDGAHAGGLAGKAVLSGEDFILCIGGDGTISNILPGIVGTNAVLGIIPAGTGNDFVRYLGLPSDPVKALDIALGGDVQKIDAGKANERYFINVAGSGFDVAVLRHTLRYKEKFSGLLPYVLGVLSAVFGFRHMKIKIAHEDRVIHRNALLFNVSNGRYFGGGMRVAPTADASDGFFDVQYVDAIPRFKILFVLSAFIRGKHTGWPIVHGFKATELTVTASDRSLQLDGEIFEEETVHYKIFPGAVNIRVPAHKS
ncbi:MAG: diacylglycerol kinase family lipid kinase [Oscillospiraceae bacterium]|nr:diacylglycerol kinase family lipid kinase [Oscillospiraceae bacterium]